MTFKATALKTVAYHFLLIMCSNKCLYKSVESQDIGPYHKCSQPVHPVLDTSMMVVNRMGLPSTVVDLLDILSFTPPFFHHLELSFLFAKSWKNN